MTDKIAIKYNDPAALFVMVYHHVIDNYQLDCYELATYIVLLRYAGADTYAYPSYKTIGEKTKQSRNRVIKSIDGLVKAGLITVEARTIENQKTSNLYHMTPLFTYTGKNSSQGSTSQGRGVVPHKDGGSTSQVPKEYTVKNIQGKESSPAPSDRDWETSYLFFGSQ